MHLLHNALNSIPVILVFLIEWIAWMLFGAFLIKDEDGAFIVFIVAVSFSVLSHSISAGLIK